VTGSPAVRIDGAILDLDDTLYPQSAFLEHAWDVVADAAGSWDVPRHAARAALARAAAGGSDRGGIIDRAFAAWPDVDLRDLVAAFHDAVPERLEPYVEAVAALERLRERLPVALVSDGHVATQEKKLRALGLENAFDAVVWSDLWGRAFRKPHPLPFHLAAGRLGLPADRLVVIGDRPDKDIAGAIAAGMRTLRVRTGEYADVPDVPDTWKSAPDLTSAVGLVLPYVPISVTARRGRVLATPAG
jgi:putative hydrolase of the HAD superfamily